MHNHRWKTFGLTALMLGSLALTRPAAAGVTLYGITGDGSFTPSTLFTIDTATAAATPVLALDNSGDFPDGEGIAFNPHDGLVYRMSGWRPGSQVFQAIDPITLTVGPNLSLDSIYGPDAASEVQGIAWYEPLDVFLVTSINFHLYHVTPDGHFTEAGTVGEWVRGLAVVGDRVFGIGPRSVVGFDEVIWEIDPNSGEVLDELDLTINGQATWGTALTTHPVTGEVFGIIINPEDRAGARLLARVDVTTGVATAIGSTGERFAGLTFVVTPDPVIPVEIDIKPGDDLNAINPGSKGVVPVAIFSTEDFDATSIDPTTISLAGAQVAVRGRGQNLFHEEDVNEDGLLDRICHVETESLTFDVDAGEVRLVGETYDGQQIEGYDLIVVVPPSE